MTTPWANTELGGRFWVIWSAGLVSYLGDGVTNGALPLLAASLSSSPLSVSLVSAASTVGWLLLGLVSGAVADRCDRLSVMWRTNLIRGAVTAILVILVFTGTATIVLLIGVSLVLGLASPFFDNAASAVIPELVPEHALESANAANQTSLLLMSGLIGPPLGAILFAASHGAPFSLDAASFLIAAAFLARTARRDSKHMPSADKQRIWGSLREGVSFLYRHRMLRSLALILGAVNACTSGVAASLVLYVLHVLHLPGIAYGWILAGYAVGGALGSLLGVMLIRRWGQRTCTMASLIATAAAILAVGLLPSLAIVIPAVMLAGFGLVVRNVALVSYRQRSVERRLLGRVSSVYRMIIFVSIPAGTVVIGALGSAFGLRVAYTIAGIALAATALVAIPTVRQLPGPRRIIDETSATAG